MNKSKTIPPKLARRFLHWFLKDDIAEEVQGDLDEKFYTTLENKSPFRAKLNYWYQVFNYLRPFAVINFRSNISNFTIMFQHNLKIGWRSLSKNKGYSSINIFGLAIGMAVAMLTGLWIHDELSYNKYHKNFDNIAKVYRNQVWKGDGKIWSNTSQVTGLGTLLSTSYRNHFKHVVMVRARIEERVISSRNKNFTQPGYFMQSDGPEMFSLKMVYGTREGLKDKNAILLSQSLAKKLFGDEDPINNTVKMDDLWDLKVTGVYEDLPNNSEFKIATYFAPLDLYLNSQNATLDNWDNYNMDIYTQIHPDADFDELSVVIKDTMKPHINEAAKKPELFLHPMSKWYLYSEFENGVMVTSDSLKFVWFYGTIGVFILLLACINFMNLSTARSEKRAKEIGIRKSIGSLRKQLISQFLSESMLVVVVAFVVSVFMVQFILPWFNGITDKEMNILWTNTWFLMASLSFIFFTALLAGSYPAFYLSSFNPVRSLKGTFRSGRHASVPRKVLVIFQFTISVSLIIGTIIVNQQIQFAKDRPVGYSHEGLVTLRPRSPEYRGKYHVLRNELKNTGVVDEMAGSSGPTSSLSGQTRMDDWKGKDSEFNPLFHVLTVTHEYGKTIGWQFLEGRDFSRDSPSDLSGIVINESTSKLLGLENPVGEIVEKQGNKYNILGVVRDMVKGSPYEPPFPSIIFLSENDLNWLYIKITTGVNTRDALSKIEMVFNKIIPSAPFDYQFVDQIYDAKFRGEERIGMLAGFFALLAILISCLGLFGLASYMAEQRTKEIGIRKVLGASVARIWQLLTREFVLLVFLSCFIAIPIAYFVLNSWLQKYEYRMELSWWIFGIAGVGALLITIITISYQAIKSAMVNPVDSLRSE